MPPPFGNTYWGRSRPAAARTTVTRPLIVTGKLYEEATIARIALAYEQATEWKDKHPALTLT